MRTKLTRTRWLMTMAAGGSALLLQGCDPTVRDTVLTGLGSAATSLTSTLIQAFFESLQAEAAETDDQTATVVRGFDLEESIFS